MLEEVICGNHQSRRGGHGDYHIDDEVHPLALWRVASEVYVNRNVLAHFAVLFRHYYTLLYLPSV